MRLLRATLALVAWTLLVVAGAGIAAGLALAWRLSAGPIDVTAAVRDLAVSDRLPVAVGVRRATLGWAGLQEGLAAPLVLALDGFSVAGGPGAAPLDRVERLAIALSPGALLRLRVAPFSIAAAHGGLRLHRRADGGIEFAPGVPLDRASGRPPAGPAQAGGAAPGFWHWIRLVRLDDLDLVVSDDAEGVTWSVRHAGAVLTRAAGDAVLTGRVDATLAHGAASARLRVRLDAAPGGRATRVAADLAPVDPSLMGGWLPGLAAVRAPVGLHAEASLGPDLAPRAAMLRATLGGGVLDGIAIAGGGLVLACIPDPAATLAAPAGRLDITEGTLRFPDGTAAGLSGGLSGGFEPGATLGGRIEVASEAVPLAGLAAKWPQALATGARRWVTTNLDAGTVRTLRIEARLASHDGLAGLALTQLGGGFAGDGLAIHWLRPVPPVTDARATLRFEGPDALAIAVASGRQGRISVAGSTVRITGLTAPEQSATIGLHVSGGVADVLDLLAAPRLRLLSRRPVPFRDPSGTAEAEVRIALPLDDKVTMDAIAIGVHAALSDVHLGDLALDRDLDDGRLTLDADTDGLALAGTGRFAGLPVAVDAAFDFRAGPPGQVTERAGMRTTASPASLAAAGLPLEGAGAGTVTLAARWEAHRDGTSAVAADADLTAAAVSLPLGWHKAAGAAAHAHVALALEGGRLAGLRSLAADGPGLDVAGHGTVADGRVRTLVVDRARIGRTDLSGRIDLPDAPGGRYRIAAHGPSLDLSSHFAKPEARPKEAPKPERQAGGRPAPGPAWSATLAVDRLTLANDATFDDVRARLAGRGARLLQGEARAAGTSAVAMRMTADAGGRTLAISSDDAGRLLAGVDVTRRIHGGTLSLEAMLPDAGSAAPVSGVARLTGFRIDRVPATARLLRDLTLYGLADRAPGAGMTITRLVAPFDYAEGTIVLRHARAFQAALGLTAEGRIDTDTGAIAIDGTIVPAYALNMLPGRIPLIGRLFSPERGGGLFAATYTLRGTVDAPEVRVNPLAALVPGVLRDLLHP